MPYVSLSQEDRKEMLHTIGVRDPEALFGDIPRDIQRRHLNLPKGLSELELSRHMRDLAHKTSGAHTHESYLGAGAYEHFIPSTVSALTSRGEFATAYTPYQAEASQGTLTWIFEFQTLVARLTGMDIANASLYDGASAMAEGAMLAYFAKKRKRIVLSGTLHPHYKKVVRTYLSGLPVEVIEIPPQEGGRPNWKAIEGVLDSDVNALLVSSPNFFGQLEDIESIAGAVHEAGALLVESSNPIALGVVKTPAEHGADISVGETQPFGNAMAFGGPYCGWFACRQEHLRRIPGRLVSETQDTQGRRAFVLTLQTREQHIRRERATSNICTNQGLCALASTICMASLGPEGLRELAELNIAQSHYAYESLLTLDGVRPFTTGPFFNEFAIRLPKPVAKVNAKLLKTGIIGGLDLGRFYPELDHVALFAVTETKTKEMIDRLTKALQSAIL